MAIKIKLMGQNKYATYDNKGFLILLLKIEIIQKIVPVKKTKDIQRITIV